MNDVFKKLRFRFVWICLSICGIFLLVVFISVYTFMSIKTNNDINGIIDESSNLSFVDFRNNNQISQGSKCIKMREAGDEVEVLEAYDYYYQKYGQDVLNQLATSACNSQFGKNKIDSYSFVIQSKIIDNQEVFIIYDATVEYSSLSRLANIFVFVYLGSIIAIFGFSWIISKKTIKPVEDAFSKQKELVANASHELKTPLAIISTSLSIIESEPDRSVGSNEKWLDNVNEQIKRMDKLVLDMLNLSKLDYEKNIELDNVDVTNMIKRNCLTFEATCFEKDIELITNISDDVIVKTDLEKIERLLMIILDNALKYTPKNNKIYVNLLKDGKIAYIKIRNTGSFVKKENQERIFERFFKEDESRSSSINNRSFGLGLSIAKALCENLGGNIKCESSEDEKYTEFIISFKMNN